MNKGGTPENLKPFKKGQSGNPKGRPKLPGLKELLEEIGEADMRDIIGALYAQAKKGNVKAIQEVLDRYYGKVKQEIDQKNTNVNYNTIELSKEEIKDINEELENEC